MGTIRCSSMCRTGTPDWRSADSNVNEQPRRNATKSSRHSLVMSVTSAARLAVPVDPVLRDVRPEVGPGRDAGGLGVAGIRHLDQGARARVPLAEDEEVVGLRPGQDHEVRLHVAGREARRCRPCSGPGGWPAGSPSASSRAPSRRLLGSAGRCAGHYGAGAEARQRRASRMTAGPPHDGVRRHARAANAGSLDTLRGAGGTVETCDGMWLADRRARSQRCWSAGTRATRGAIPRRPRARCRPPVARAPARRAPRAVDPGAVASAPMPFTDAGDSRAGHGADRQRDEQLALGLDPRRPRRLHQRDARLHPRSRRAPLARRRAPAPLAAPRRRRLSVRHAARRS